jgi:hypothetical protein
MKKVKNIRYDMQHARLLETFVLTLSIHSMISTRMLSIGITKTMLNFAT